MPPFALVNLRKAALFMSHLPVSHRLKNVLLVLAGNALYALAVEMFILPCNLITGGTTGLALIGQHWFGISVANFVMVSNIIMFVLGAVIMGKWFALNTALSTFCYPIFLKIFSFFPEIRTMTANPMLATVFAGVMIGVAIGMVIGAGASSGGLDIPPIIANKYWGIPVSVVMYALDFIILIGQMFFADKEQILYGILLVLLYTVVLDKVVVMGHSKIQVKILSANSQEIRQLILNTLDRGCTLLHAQTGFAQQEQDMVLTVITSREVARLKQLVQQIDPNAFMIIDSVNEVHGRGFTLRKVYK